MVQPSRMKTPVPQHVQNQSQKAFETDVGAAALLVSLGDFLVGGFRKNFNCGLIRPDPIRVIEAIVTVVAFLGAGNIVRRGGQSGH